MASTQASKAIVLNSWKEIAAYLGRGVRTVQRYERDLGLPVRRPRGKSRSAVIAMTDEIDAWLRNAPRGLDDNTAVEPVNSYMPLVRPHVSAFQELRERCRELREAHTRVLTSLMESLSSLDTSLKETRSLTRLPPPPSDFAAYGRTTGRT